MASSIREHTSNIGSKIETTAQSVIFKGAFYELTYNIDRKFSQSQICLLFDLSEQSTIDLFKKVSVLVAPLGIKHMVFEPEKALDNYISDSWVSQNICTALESTHIIPGHFRAQRKQYGLKYRVTATIHANMGDTLPSVAFKISQTNSNFKLWGKEQVIVALSQIKEAKDTILAGNKTETINALVALLKTRTQWTDYMESVLSLVSINSFVNSAVKSPVLSSIHVKVFSVFSRFLSFESFPIFISLILICSLLLLLDPPLFSPV